ncbi:hypothetical protein LA342_08880 [Campylobacter upsaliensis]|uniref:PBECR3 domain-containing polyvalent protein n=1 Tax=Campylobacter upsaliensis TaxID=28080 RepID=UPI001CE124FA|nr:LPD23 domain-containing protein [Campylobacter upsaliensis]MCA5589872.1 hypothetical protein [Campylobacter upsaliensis]
MDLVWGDENFGLRHIIEKHGGEFEDIAKDLSEAMENGVLKKQNEVRSRIEYGNFVIGLSGEFKGEKRAFIITAFNRKGKSSTLSPKQDFTDKSDDVLSNQESIITQNANTINILKDMQDKDLNTKLGDKDLLDLYANASRDIVQNMENASFELDFIHQIKQYNDNLFTFFEKNPQFKELSLFKNFYNHLQNIIRKKQIENFTKPLNSKTEISTKSGNIYYFDEKHNLLKNPQEKPIKKDEIVLNEKGDTLLLSDTHLVLTNKNKDFKDRYIHLLTNSDKREVLQFANFFQNGLTLENKKLFDLFKSIPKAAFMKYPLEILMQIFNDIVPNNKATIPFYAEFAKKHYGSVDNFNKDFLQKMDRQYKENGNPFGILFNDEVTIKEFSKEYFKGKNAIDFLLKAQAGHIENAFYREELGDIDLVWGDENFGLRHILEQRAKQWGEEKALKFISHLSENIEKGQIVELEKGRVGIKTDLTTIILDKKENNNFVLTAFRDRNNKKELESLNLSQSKTFTSENAETNAKESPVTPLNQESIIAQNSEKLPFEMQVFAEDKLSGDEVRYLANKIGEKSTMSYFKDYLLKMDRDFHTRAKDIIREYYKIEPFRKELENQWENVKEAYKNGEMSLKEFKFLSKYKDEKSFLNQVARVLWHHNNELVKNQGYTFNKYGQIEQGKGDNYYQNLALEYDGALKNLKKWFYYIQKANKQAQSFFNKNEPQDLKAKESARGENENEKLKSDLLDKTKPLRKAEKEELTNELLEEAKEQNAKIWVGNLESENLADELGLNFQKGVKITMNGNALKHIEKRHGVNSTLAKNGQPIVENEDYANHAKIVNEADKRKIILSEDNQKILVSGKQINGYHIIIESISTKDNELKLKTMYKENGSLENSNIFKEPVRDRISGGESLRVNPSNALDPNGLNESIAQNAGEIKPLSKKDWTQFEKHIEYIKENYGDIFLQASGEYHQKKRELDIKELEREQKGLFNVAYNGKNATLIKKDLEAVEEAIALMQGTRYKGAKHERIKHLTDPSKEGYITDLEFVNLGKSIREFLESYEPFIDKNRARIYEWENKDKVRFRVVVNDVADMDSNPTTATEEIITFYSDRNLKEKMKFKNPVLKVQEKFKFNPQKAKDLLEWHKDSHALTKDENGLPKVFYHGTYAKFEVFKRAGKASQQGFFFTPSQKATEEYGDITLNTFLNIKNPFRADELKINKEADLQKWADILKLDYDKEKYESFKDLKTKLEKVKEATKKAGFKFHSASGGGVYVIDNKGRNSFINLEELDKENKRVVEAFKGLETEDIYFYYVVRNEFDLVLYALNKNDRYFHTSGRDEVKRVLEKLGYDGAVLNDTIITVFNSNQIKHIDNKGSFTDTKGNVTSKKPKNKEVEFSYFNEKSDNIYHSNPHLGAGLVGGVLNGVEQDEEGNLSFDPAKFAMGFLGGAVGSKAVSSGIKWRANKVKKAYPNIAKNNPVLMEQIAKRDLLTYAKNETQNALTRFLNKNKHFDSTRGLFAGEKALLNEAYAPHKARLAKAKELESKGADEIEIWEKTGWYKDKDNKWKFEISQRGGELKLKYTPKNKAADWLVYSIGVEKNLADFLDDKELFKAYPQLKDIKIKTFTYQESADSPFVVGRYEQDKKEIKLNAENIDTDMEKAKSFLYHEIQHAIQDIEGFAYGEHLSMYSKDNYRLRHGEVEARNVQKRLRGRGKPYTKEDAKRGLEILNASIKRIEQGIQNVKNGVGEYKDETQETKDFILQNYDSDLREALEDKEYVLHFINDEIYNRTPHPHKTMDTPLSETIAETTIQGEALSKANPSNLSALRNETKELLKPFTHKPIENKNDNTKAIVTMSGVKEMLSVKAIKQSVKNGFKAKQHIKAVKALPALFEKAIFKERQKQRHFKDYVEAYRVYSADFEGGKAIISVQERKVGDDVLYFLKLDELRLNNA